MELMSYRLTWEKNGVVFELSGVVTGREMIETSREIARDTRRFGMKYQIVNFLNIERFDITGEEVRTIAQLDKKISEVGGLTISQKILNRVLKGEISSRESSRFY